MTTRIFSDMIEVALGGAGDQVRTYCSVIEALVGLDEPPPVDLLITHIHFPPAEKNGITACADGTSAESEYQNLVCGAAGVQRRRCRPGHVPVGTCQHPRPTRYG